MPLPIVPAIDAHNHLGRWLALFDDWLALDPAELVRGGERPWVCGRRRGDRDARRGGRRGDRQPRRPLGGRARAQSRPLRPRPPRPLPDVLPRRPALHRPARTSTPGRSLRACGARSDAGARGLKIWKDLGLEHPRRTAAQYVLPDDERLSPRVRGRRRARPPGADPHGRSGGLLGSRGRRERAARGAAREARVVVRQGRLPALRPAHGVARGAHRRPAGNDVHRGARRLLPREPRLGRPHAHELPEHGDRRLAGAWPSSAASRGRPRA